MNYNEYISKYQESVKKMNFNYKMPRPFLYYFYRALMVDIKIFFPENFFEIEDDGFIVISNHVSNFDPSFTMLLPREINFLAKKSLGSLPILGWAVKKNAILINRKSPTSALKEGILHLKKKKNLGIFIEGTREEEGKFENAKNGAAFIASRVKCPVIPIAIRNTGTLMGKGQIIPRVTDIEIVVGDPMKLEKYYDKNPKEIDLDEMTKDFLEEIKRLYHMDLTEYSKNLKNEFIWK
jgi:1-acyl-sn-glycerol-3-phosphate acyltransferase